LSPRFDAQSPADSFSRRLLPGLAGLEEGLGSAYERYAVGTLTENLVAELGAVSVAEWPANGVLGVPGLKSMPLAAAGCEVTLLSPESQLLDGASRVFAAAGLPRPRLIVGDPEDDHHDLRDAFHLVWSFCAFEHARHRARLAETMVRVSSAHVLVFVQNAWMPGVHMHRLEHLVERRPWDHGSLDAMRAELVARELENAGARIVRVGGCDLPPWPDLNVKLPRPWRRRSSRGAPRAYGPGDPRLDFAAAAECCAKPPPLSPLVRALARWHDVVETRIPTRILRFLAHHPYVLARKL
jgi:hypothetical protein